jgi:hypothetical protein
MTARGQRVRAANEPEGDHKSRTLEDEIEAERKQLFKAMAIIQMCRSASDSGETDLDYHHALLVAYELIDDSATRLEGIGSAERAISVAKRMKRRRGR